MKKFISISISLGLIFTLIFGYLYRQQVKDFVVANYSTQQVEAIDLSEKLDLTNKGDQLYKSSKPEILSSTEFNNSCQTVQKEKSIVLGCYTKQRLYIYKVDDSRLDGVEEVTAAHELLHAVYERMSKSDKQELDKELILAADSITDPHFVQLVAEYRKTEPTELNNEIHSILGTEIAVLPTSLENHYAKYFKDRQKIVAYSNNYQDVFKKNTNQIEVFDKQLAELKKQIDSLDSQLKMLEPQLTLKQRELARLRSADVDAYNLQVPIFNSLVNQYNSLVNDVKKLTDQYNTVVVNRNSVAQNQDDLSKKLDSNYQTK